MDRCFILFFSKFAIDKKHVRTSVYELFISQSIKYDRGIVIKYEMNSYKYNYGVRYESSNSQQKFVNKINTRFLNNLIFTLTNVVDEN